MEVEPPQHPPGSVNDGLGSWHPARRPNADHESESASRASSPSVNSDENATSTLHSLELLGAVDSLSTFQAVSPDQSHELKAANGENSEAGKKSAGVTSQINGAHIVEKSTENAAVSLKSSQDTGLKPEGSGDESLELQQETSITNGILNSEESKSGAEKPLSWTESDTVPDDNSFFKGDDHKMPGFEQKFDEISSAFSSDTRTLPRSWAISYTNSFPTVPPLHQAKVASSLQPLPHSQIEDLVGSSQSHDSEQGNAQTSLLDDIQAANEESFFDNVDRTEGTGISDADEQARFEEGLPLVSSGSNHGMSTTPDDQMERAPISDPLALPTAHDDNFLDDVTFSHSENPPDFKPPLPDRKTTSQVLNSMSYPPHNETHDLPKLPKEPIGAQTLTRVQSTSSPNKGLPLKIDNILEEGNNNTEARIKLEGTQEEDLASLWQAALADDELLDDENLADPTSFFDEDGEGFLEDESPPQVNARSERNLLPPQLPQYTEESNLEFHQFPAGQKSATQDKFTPTQQQTAPTLMRTQSQKYTPQATSWSASLPKTISAPQGFSNPTSLQRPSLPEKTQSFADKSKGGYTSPYDLPMDVTRPKKRANLYSNQSTMSTQIASNRAPPPPRSSSMYSNDASSHNYSAQQSPSSPSFPGVAPTTTTSNAISSSIGVAPVLRPRPSTGSFFEELPVAAKPRPSSSKGNVPSLASQPLPLAVPLSQMNAQFQPSAQVAPRPSESFHLPNVSPSHQLVQPERMPLYGNLPQQGPTKPSVAAANSRYSPAPQSQPSVSSTRTRYASSPSGPPRPPSVSKAPFQPRTSSPLTQKVSTPQQYSLNATSGETVNGPYSSLPQEGGSRTAPPSVSLGTHAEPGGQFHHSSLDSTKSHSNNENGMLPITSRTIQSFPLEARSPHESPTSVASIPVHPSSGSTYFYNDPSQHQSLEERTSTSQDSERALFGRSRSQSPGIVKPTRAAQEITSSSLQEPASVYGTTLPPPITPSYGPKQSILSAESLGRDRGSQESKFIAPNDERINDPLERWKGCPIFNFGFGGNVVTSFPKQIPRYGPGQSVPLIKCSPGEVKLWTGKILPLEVQTASFPGPLKGKSKKKDVLVWLQKKIEEFETEQNQTNIQQILPDPRRTHEEKTLLWRLMYVIVEHDGVIDGNVAAKEAVRSILSPESVISAGQDQLLHGSHTPLVGISRSSRSNILSIPIDPSDVEELRRLLVLGDREKAAWHAVDKRLWAHAMLLSSTLSKDIWKQVVQEFVRNEVRVLGDNTEPLAALYDVFAGNCEESIDELVPPSARAGLQMVSKAPGPGPTRNALDGLDKWRETLSLILSNRTSDDGNALQSLGRLLSTYGRIEAAHVCYLFAMTAGLLGGLDDPQAAVVLLGADHLQKPFDYSRDLDSVLLTEVYEFALNVLAPSPMPTISPHLQAYKLYHAMVLAEHGYRNESQQYCDGIANALKATTKLSPYYHNLLFTTLDDLTSRLRQAPKEGSASWISKPSMDKVSGSVWAKFNNFIAGDDSDAGSTGSGRGLEAEAGPFARVAGGSPELSRQPSVTDLYGSYGSGDGTSSSLQPVPFTSSRYAPTSHYTPRSSLDQVQPSPQDVQRPVLSSSLPRQPSYQSLSAFSPDLYQKARPDAYQPIAQPEPAAPSHESENYLPSPPAQPGYIPIPSLMDEPQTQRNSYQPTSHLASTATPTLIQYGPDAHEKLKYEPPGIGYEPPLTSLEEPHGTSAYMPASYEPYSQTTEDSPNEEKPKKRSFLDDDDDENLVDQAAVLSKKEKPQKDRETDEAFRKAAEADGTHS